MRVTVDVGDLEPAIEPATEREGSTIGDAVDRQARRDPTSGIARLRADRARSVAASLDLRGARVDEALEALSGYLDDASLAGLDRVTVIHGLGHRGAARRGAQPRPPPTRSPARSGPANAARAATERPSSASDGGPAARATARRVAARRARAPGAGRPYRPTRERRASPRAAGRGGPGRAAGRRLGGR